jgi:hypothetical protein
MATRFLGTPPLARALADIPLFQLQRYSRG